MSNITKPIILNETGQAMVDAIKQVASAINAKSGVCYGVHINGAKSNPDEMITYLKDAVGMTPAHMDFANDVFDYGSWEDAFFMPRPCMVKYDGTVDYYLDPNDYTKKKDGTASDVADTSYGGNAMMEWGQNGKKIWMATVPDSDPKSGSIYIADHQVDSTFHAWSFINNQGKMVDHFYTPIYNGTLVGGKLRSISGLTYSDLCQGKTASAERGYAEANNPSTDIIWQTEVYSDIKLIEALCMLISKTTASSVAFGEGRRSQASSASNMLGTGTMNAKGLFWGSNTTTYGVKVFGMENYWGNQWRRYAGHVNASGTQKVKMTYGTQDGSTATGYSDAGTGYISAGATPSGTSGGYISQMYFSDKGMLPNVASGSSTTYFCDGLWFNNGQTGYASRGGYCNNDAKVGLFYCDLSSAASHASWHIGASVSCKPLA